MTHIRSTAWLGATALVVASLVVPPALAGDMKAERRQQQHATASPQPLSAQSYVMYASNADLFEIEAARIAMLRAKDPMVKQFAGHMVQQHAMTTSKLTAAARQANVTATTPMLTPHLREKLTELQSASDTAFDERYMVAQVEAHERALRLHSHYAQNGDQPALRTASGETVRAVEQHLAEARRISSQLTLDRPGGA